MTNLTDRAIELFLNKIKEEGRSSPTGMYWNDFFLILKRHKGQNDSEPPAPLILAASGESNASKHFRLSAQIQWAATHNCLDEAFEYLDKLSSDKWNTGRIEDWNKDSYY